MNSLEELRMSLGYHKKFDILLAATFEDFEMNGLYDFTFLSMLGDRLEKDHRKGVFVPHREIDIMWSNEKIYGIPNSIIAPSVEIVVAYVGSPSTAAGIMLQSGINNRKPVILAAPNGTTIEPIVTGPLLARDLLHEIVLFGNREEGLVNVSRAVGNFYKDRR